MAHTILVVDDSEVNRVVARAKLKEAGYFVSTSNDGFEALEALKIEDDQCDPPFDAVLLDVMMPGMDGMEVLAKIRAKWSNIQLPVIMATAKDQQEDILRALGLGANDYVIKPLDLPVLMARLSTHLELKESHEALKRAQNLLMTAARSESTGLLASGVAHEIRNPLGQIQMGISGLESFAKKMPEEDREVGEMIMTTIKQAVAKADGIVVQLMRASEDQRLDLDNADLNQIVTEVVGAVKDQWNDSRVEFSLELEEGIGNVKLASDEFRQALEALVENAILAAEQAGDNDRRVIVSTYSHILSKEDSKQVGRSGNKLRAGDKTAVIAVEDFGPGMKLRELEAAFDAFYTSRATGSGTGLGLTLARKLIEMHGGMICLENKGGDETGIIARIFLKSGGALRTSV